MITNKKLISNKFKINLSIVFFLKMTAELSLEDINQEKKEVVSTTKRCETSVVSLETKILDFLSLMQQTYQKEREEQSFERIEELNADDASKKCDACHSQICKMVQECNAPLECWTSYVKHPELVYKYWMTGKVLPELMDKNFQTKK